MQLPYLFAPLVLLIPLRLMAAQADAPDCSAPTTQTETARWSCAAKLTRERTLVLDKLGHCPEGDNACPGRKP